MKSERLIVKMNGSLEEIHIPKPSREDIKISQYELNKDKLIVWFDYNDEDNWLDVDLFRIYISEDKCYAVYNIDGNLVLSNYNTTDEDNELPHHEWRV